MTKDELKNRDYVLLIDKSGSMMTKDCPGGKSRWDYAQETTLSLAAKMAEYDSDGITVIPFSSNFKEYKNITGETTLVAKIFNENEPGASTDTAKVLKHVLDGYFANNENKHITIVVVTDGVPDSQEELEKVIVEATKKMNADEQVGIQFIQIGNDTNATNFLKTLDDGLVAKGAKFDIVDTKTTDELGNMTITEALIAALED